MSDYLLTSEPTKDEREAGEAYRRACDLAEKKFSDTAKDMKGRCDSAIDQMKGEYFKTVKLMGESYDAHMTHLKAKDGVPKETREKE